MLTNKTEGECASGKSVDNPNLEERKTDKIAHANLFLSLSIIESVKL
jgi:hypothetical protein